MNVILFGATGMVGQGVLRECLLDPNVQQILSIVTGVSPASASGGNKGVFFPAGLNGNCGTLHSRYTDLYDVA